MNQKDLAFDLEDKLMELKEMMHDIEQLVSNIEDSQTRRRAESYWIPHIYQANDNDHRWLGGSMVTGMDTVEELYDE